MLGIVLSLATTSQAASRPSLSHADAVAVRSEPPAVPVHIRVTAVAPPSDSMRAHPHVVLTGPMLTAWMLHPNLDASLEAGLTVPIDTLPPGVSPIDTLRKSPLEKVFWGRHGLYRVTGLFKTDPDHPVNDIRRMIKVRRKMLSIHQIMGLATMASMTATVVGGQLAIDGRGSGLHKGSLPVTIGLYSATAALALSAPPKLIRGGGVDTITFHKAFAVLHIAGMILTPLLAPELDEGSGNAQLHQIFGYATYGAFTAGMLTVMLFR